MINAKISTKAMRENITTIRNRVGAKTKICAVIKANAYSFGDVFVARALENNVDSFAVAHLDEAKRVRGVTKKPILLFGVCESFKKAQELDLVVSINSVAEMKRLVISAQSLAIHIKVNTGLNRFGVGSVLELRRILEMAQTNPQITVEGLYTHMAFETDNTPEIDRALARFRPFVGLFRRFHPNGIVHSACSGSMHHPPAMMDMVRVGKAIYGGFDGYKTAFTIESVICATQKLRAGEVVGYGGTFVAPRAMRVGIVPCGYADVVHFNFGNRATIEVDGIPCAIVGRICMDSFMVDVTAIDQPIGKTVVIVAPKPNLELMHLMRETKTTTCDYLCGLNFSRTQVKYDE